MNKNWVFFTCLLAGMFILLSVWFFKKDTLRLPIILSGESGSLAEMDLDDLISASNLIAIGEFNSIPSGQWNTPNGKLPQNATLETVSDERLFIYTEQVFQVDQILKEDPQNREVLIRSFGGQAGIDIMQPSNTEVVYETGDKYLLFLSYYPDQTDDGTAGYYVATGSIQGVYKINGDRAVSHREERHIGELITYIQDSPLSKVDVADTAESFEIMQQIEAADGIEHACIFDFSTFPFLYTNDIRYKVSEEKLDFMRLATDNPSLEATGYLDYKITYHTWWLEGKQRWEEIYNNALIELRDISEEETNAFLASKWGTYPGGWCSPKRTSQLRFISIKIKGDIATVILGINSFANRELILVSVNENWLIAQERELSTDP